MDIPSYLLGRIKGSGGAGVNYVVVEELPTTGEEGTIYLVPKEDSQTDNVYNEYMYIEDEWELIGDTQADLSNYQTLLTSSNKLNADYIDDTNTTNKLTNATEKSTWNGKQDALVSGTNIKTINGNSVLGSGDLSVGGNNIILVNNNNNTISSYNINTQDNRDKITELYNKGNNFTGHLYIKMGTTSNFYEANQQNMILDNGWNTLNFLKRIDIVDNLPHTYSLRIEVLIQNGVCTTITKNTEYEMFYYTNSERNNILLKNNTNSYTPSGDYNPATKKYVDDNIQITQYETLPTASASNEGKIAQYIGTTDSNYTNGYFYHCVSDGQDPATYSWGNIQVQGGGSSAPAYIEDGTGARMYIIKYSTNTDYQNNIMKPVFKELVNHSNYSVFIDDDRDIDFYDQYTITNYTGIYKHYIQSGSHFLKNITPLTIGRDMDWESRIWNRGTNILLSLTQEGEINNFSFNSQNTSLANFLSTTKNYSTPFTPTNAGHPATKKYVDNKPTTYTGYDATKTQVLKNINGTLTWVDET